MLHPWSRIHNTGERLRQPQDRAGVGQPDGAPAAGAEARNARWRGGAAGATGVLCAEQRLYSFSWKLLPVRLCCDLRTYHMSPALTRNHTHNCFVACADREIEKFREII